MHAVAIGVVQAVYRTSMDMLTRKRASDEMQLPEDDPPAKRARTDNTPVEDKSLMVVSSAWEDVNDEQMRTLWQRSDLDRKSFGSFKDYFAMVGNAPLPVAWGDNRDLQQLITRLTTAMEAKRLAVSKAGMAVMTEEPLTIADAVDDFTHVLTDVTFRDLLGRSIVIWMAAAWRLGILQEAILTDDTKTRAQPVRLPRWLPGVVMLQALRSQWKLLSACKRLKAIDFWNSWTTTLIIAGNKLASDIAKHRTFDKVDQQWYACLRNSGDPATGTWIGAPSAEFAEDDVCECMSCFEESLEEARRLYVLQTEKYKAHPDTLFMCVSALLGPGLIGEGCISWPTLHPNQLTRVAKASLNTHIKKMKDLEQQRVQLGNVTHVAVATGGGVVSDGWVALSTGPIH